MGASLPGRRTNAVGIRHDAGMRIRALSVFEGVVYHCWPIDRTHPERPTLEVDALLRDGDADESSGPLLVTVSDYSVMVGDPQVAHRCVEGLRAKGRVVEWLGVEHISFPMWTRVSPGDTAGPALG